MFYSRDSLPAIVLFTVAAVAVHPTPLRAAASPTSLSFAYKIGAALPPLQSLSLTGAGFYSASATSSRNWLTIGALIGPLPSSLAVTATPQGLAAGSYTGAISLLYQNAPPQTIPVTLLVTPADPPPGNSIEGLLISPTSLGFTFQYGAAIPPSRAFTSA